MPLPTPAPNDTFPPKQLERILPAMTQWSAWYSGDLAKLQSAYGGGPMLDQTGFFASDKGGFRATVNRTLQRWFVGEPARGPERNTKLPIPIAAEMCQASADLLFSDPVVVTVDNEATQERVEELLDERAHSTFAAAAESAAALGGVYLRATWDTSVIEDAPFTTVQDADTAIPEFRWGRLMAVSFWSVVATDGKHVYRLVERHELDSFGVGIILHGLYEGENDRLGTRISLTSRPETAALALNVDLNLEGTISTMSPGLAVTYVPNQTPNRLWRDDPIGHNLGRSDLDGVEHLMDQLAETMSDWMRARRVARARILLSKELLKSSGPGNGNVIDVSQEVFTSLNSLDGKDAPLSQKVQLLQPQFDPAQYQQTAQALIEQILQMAGYSMQTFGIEGQHSSQRTATEIESKERRSLMTRARKTRLWKPALEEHLRKLLAIDKVFFGHTENNTEGLSVEFSDGVQESQLKLAQTVQALFLAESASLEERVSILHPDWSDEQISDEVDLVRAEFAHAPVADPVMAPFGDPTNEPGVDDAGDTPTDE